MEQTVKAKVVEVGYKPDQRGWGIRGGVRVRPAIMGKEGKVENN